MIIFFFSCSVLVADPLCGINSIFYSILNHYDQSLPWHTPLQWKAFLSCSFSPPGLCWASRPCISMRPSSREHVAPDVAWLPRLWHLTWRKPSMGLSHLSKDKLFYVYNRVWKSLIFLWNVAKMHSNHCYIIFTMHDVKWPQPQIPKW